MIKTNVLLSACALGIAFTMAAPVTAKEPSKFQRGCEAGLTFSKRAFDTMAKSAVKVARRLSELDDRRAAWVDAQYEKLPAPLREKLSNFASDLARAEFRAFEIQYYASMYAQAFVEKQAEDFKHRVQSLFGNVGARRNFNLKQMNWITWRTDPEVDWSQATSIVLPKAVFLFAGQRKFPRRFPAGATLTLEESLVVEADASQGTTTTGMILEVMYDIVTFPLRADAEFTSRRLMSAYRESLRRNTMPANLWIALERVIGSSLERDRFNHFEIAKMLYPLDAAPGASEMTAARRALFHRVLDQAIESPFEQVLTSDLYLFVKGKRWPKKFRTGQTIRFESWQVVDAKD